MANEQQGVMFPELAMAAPPPQPKAETEPEPDRRPRFKPIDRDQTYMDFVDLQKLIEPDHPARAIWDLTGEVDLSAFYAPIQAVEGKAGQAANHPRLLLALWIYSYSRKVTSAREVERLCEYHPAYRWLTGGTTVCAHTLSDFRVDHEEALRAVMAQVLALLHRESLVDLTEVTQDGTKIKANAGVDTLRREASIQEHLEKAREWVRELDEADEEGLSQQAVKARERGAREKAERMQQAMQEMEKVRAAQDGAAKKEKPRVSLTDPEARMMKQSDGGYAPSYNVQITTSAKQKIIVAQEVSQSASDARELVPALERVEEQWGQPPERMIADGGYTNKENIVEAAQKKVDFIGSLPDTTAQTEALYARRGVAEEFRPAAFRYDAEANCLFCPAGKTLAYKTSQQEIGRTDHIYRASRKDCGACPHKQRCCPKAETRGRTIVRGEDAPEVAEFRAKMETDEAKAIYRKRGAVAEFPHAWIKEKLGLRQFSVRGLAKVKLEVLWVCLTYNVQQWTRLCWRTKLAQAL